jgi:hypothetical protein
MSDSSSQDEHARLKQNVRGPTYDDGRVTRFKLKGSWDSHLGSGRAGLRVMT